MTFILEIFFLLWVIRLIANILSYTHLWFVKEYRWDRMLIHLKTKQGRMFLFLPLRRPPVSPKTILMTLLLLIFVSATLIYLPLNILLRFILADLLLFPESFLLVGILRLPTVIYHQIKIVKARAELEKHQKMITVGITGSYGKTSTKEYLATILESQHKVLKTEASKNSAIGIAEVILAKLKPEHEIFIVEMGAYRRGEINDMTNLVKPEIGIITAVNPQHQDLFKTIETTMKAKYELIAGLRGKKVAIFNADNDLVREMAGWAINQKYSVWSVGHTGKKISKADDFFEIKDVAGDMSGIAFKLTHRNETLLVKAPVLGEHLATNVTLAIAGAVAAGMSFKEAVEAAKNVKPFAKTMQPVPGINGSLFINDTFNNNPDAAIAAVNFLVKTKGRKFLIFQPMIELGSFAQISHESVGEKASSVCDEIILTNGNFSDYFISGVKKSGRREVKVKILSSGQAANYLKRIVKKGDTVLFKGKEAENILKLLTH